MSKSIVQLRNEITGTRAAIKHGDVDPRIGQQRIDDLKKQIDARSDLGDGDFFGFGSAAFGPPSDLEGD